MTKLNDNLGNRMKSYEGLEAHRILMPGLPVLLRLDGKSFHTWTAGLARPYDVGLMQTMQLTTKELVAELNAVIGYTQSDEITLLFNYEPPQEPLYGGRVQKFCSIAASMCSTFFMKALEIYLPERADKPAFFDCRVWNTPNKMEAVNAIVWRELDATKNAVSTAAHTLIGHKELQNKSGSEMQEMLFTQHGINFNEYPTEFKRGAYFRKLACRDQPYNADPSLREPTRNKVFQIELPQLSKVANKIEVIFDNADPILHEKLP